MQGLGLNISSGRTKHYAKLIEYWQAEYNVASKQEGKDAFPDFVSSMFEIMDFVDIYRSLKEVSKTKLQPIADKLQKGINGPINSAEETSKSTTARNFIFEALVASRCHVPEMSVETIFHSKSDTGIKVETKKIWVECKRITSLNKLERNVRDACNQLERVISKKVGSGHRGLIAIDFTKILHKGDKLLVKSNDAELQAAITGIMELFIHQYSSQWEKVYKTKSNKIIGTLLRFSTMASSEERNLLVRVSDWAINPKLNILSADEIILRNLTKVLNDGRT